MPPFFNPGTESKFFKKKKRKENMYYQLIRYSHCVNGARGLGMKQIQKYHVAFTTDRQQVRCPFPITTHDPI
jgi:hypothetical protein